MRIVKKQRVKTIEAYCGEDYERQYDKIMEDIAMYNPKTVDMDNWRAKIYYEQEDEIPESYEDQAMLKGLCTICALCPFFEDAHKGNQKKGGCSVNQRDWTMSDWHACEYYYEKLLKGEL